MAVGLNDYGAISGVYVDGKKRTHGFVLSGGTFTRIDYPRMDDLQATLASEGVRIARINIRQIFRKAGYKFYKARKVLTSTDPEYRKKLEHIKKREKNLRANLAFAQQRAWFVASSGGF